jgi:saccharopine dehydrogenase-like NADP-dependent oxidoreductase
LPQALASTGAGLVIHTTGPFQTQDYTVPERCIDHGVHRIDIAAGRDFVAGFARLAPARIDGSGCRRRDHRPNPAAHAARGAPSGTTATAGADGAGRRKRASDLP